MRMRNTIICTFVALFFLSGYANSQSFDLNKVFQLSAGQEATNKKEKIAITLTKISDTRCKPGLYCIWPGKVEMRVTAKHQNTDTSSTFKLPGIEKTYMSLGKDGQYIIDILGVVKKPGKTSLKTKNSDTLNIIVRKKADTHFCPTNYNPVCAIIKHNVHCSKAPCPVFSMYKTFSNQCNADQQNAIFVFNGPCGQLEGRQL